MYYIEKIKNISIKIFKKKNFFSNLNFRNYFSFLKINQRLKIL
jgi:hypothetical protein